MERSSSRGVRRFLSRGKQFLCAREISLKNRFGSLEPGKAADLAVLNGNPIADYHQIGSPVTALFMGGKLVVKDCGLS